MAGDVIDISLSPAFLGWCANANMYWVLCPVLIVRVVPEVISLAWVLMVLSGCILCAISSLCIIRALLAKRLLMFLPVCVLALCWNSCSLGCISINLKVVLTL